jgi:hypothetical protein
VAFAVERCVETRRVYVAAFRINLPLGRRLHLQFFIFFPGALCQGQHLQFFFLFPGALCQGLHLQFFFLFPLALGRLAVGAKIPHNILGNGIRLLLVFITGRANSKLCQYACFPRLLDVVDQTLYVEIAVVALQPPDDGAPGPGVGRLRHCTTAQQLGVALEGALAVIASHRVTRGPGLLFSMRRRFGLTLFTGRLTPFGLSWSACQTIFAS